MADLTQTSRQPAKTFSAGYERSRLYSYWTLLRYFRRNRQFAVETHRGFEQLRDAFQRHGRVPVASARMLEIGCGQRFATALLFHSVGANITAIDTDAVDPRFSVGLLLRIWRRNGFERCLKTAVRHLLFDRAFYSTLAREFGAPLRWEDLDLRLQHAGALPFPDGHFDFAYSNAVFEHIDDVDAATKELARVLQPGGIAVLEIHLFPSLSGGHNLEWAFPEESPSRSVPPWDHLRQNLYPAHVYLNRLRERDYVEIFQRHLVVLDSQARYEGERFLTDALLAELAAYAREELLKRSIRVVLRKD